MQWYAATYSKCSKKFAVYFWSFAHFKDLTPSLLYAINVQTVQNFLWSVCSQTVHQLYFIHAILTPRLLSLSDWSRKTGGGGRAAVRGGSTLTCSRLDQGPDLDMNMERSSLQSPQPVTLVQSQLTESALTVSLPGLWMSFKTGRYRNGGGEREQSSSFLS